MANNTYICLDVGEKRIGVAIADDAVRIAVPFETISVDGTEKDALQSLVDDQQPSVIVVGYPRNQAGEATAQTRFVETFCAQFADILPSPVYQDESLTSVLAEQRLKEQGGTYSKGDIDAHAAAIILQDYLEART